MIEEIKNYTVDTYKQIINSSAADYVRENKVVVGIIATIVLGTIGYATYTRYWKDRDVTVNPNPKPIPGPDANHNAFAEKVSAPFKISELCEHTDFVAETVIENAKDVAKNIDYEDLKTFIEKRTPDGFQECGLIIAMANANENSDKLKIFEKYAGESKSEFLVDAYKFEKASKGDLEEESTTVPDFIQTLCKDSITDLKLFKEYANALGEIKTNNVLKLYSSFEKDDDKNTFLCNVNQQTLSALLGQLKSGEDTKIYKETLQKTCALHFSGKIQNEPGKNHLIFALEANQKVAQDALQNGCFSGVQIKELKAFTKCYAYMTFEQILKSCKTNSKFATVVLTHSRLTEDQMKQLYAKIPRSESRRRVFASLYEEDIKTYLNLVVSQKFTCQDLPSEILLDQLLQRKESVKTNLLNLESYIGRFSDKDDTPKPKMQVLYNFNLLIAKDKDLSNAIFEYTENKTLMKEGITEFCKQKNMKHGNQTYKLMKQKLLNPLNEDFHIEVIADALSTLGHLKSIYDGSTDQEMKQRIYTVCQAKSSLKDILDKPKTTDKKNSWWSSWF